MTKEYQEQQQQQQQALLRDDGLLPPPAVPMAQPVMQRNTAFTHNNSNKGDMMEQLGGSLVPFNDSEVHEYVNGTTMQQVCCSFCCPACQVGHSLTLSQRSAFRSTLCCMLFTLSNVGHVGATARIAGTSAVTVQKICECLGFCTCWLLSTYCVAREINTVNQEAGGESHTCRYMWYLTSVPCLFTWQVARAVHRRTSHNASGAIYMSAGQ